MELKDINPKTLNQIKECLNALNEKKADDIKILYIGEKSSVTDYMIIATATSHPHLKALSVNLQKTLKAAGIQMIGADTDEGSGWIVVDAFDFMMHIFLKEERGIYRLESLWNDGETIEIDELVAV